MPHCENCGGGKWVCGDGDNLCAAAGDWDDLGVVMIPVGIGPMVVPVAVSTRMVQGKCQVRLLSGDTEMQREALPFAVLFHRPDHGE
jgi:hypothetical protein